MKYWQTFISRKRTALWSFKQLNLTLPKKQLWNDVISCCVKVAICWTAPWCLYRHFRCHWQVYGLCPMTIRTPVAWFLKPKWGHPGIRHESLHIVHELDTEFVACGNVIYILEFQSLTFNIQVMSAPPSAALTWSCCGKGASAVQKSIMPSPRIFFSWDSDQALLMVLFISSSPSE